VASGLAALEQIEREGVPALILLDVVMPGMTGQELLDILREHPSTAQVPVVVMTAATPALTAPLPGADGFLSKPFDLRELLAAASRWCDAPPGAALAQP
jgi:CheY-like chemotaxis protein